MNMFLLTDGMIKEIKRMMNIFWWGSKRTGGGGGGIPWMRWERLSIRKEFGRMKFRDIIGFNLAMLGKQGWKLLNDPTALFSRVYKAKYFPIGDFLSAALDGSPSYIWRSIQSTQAMIKRGYRWRLGDGNSIRVYLDLWLRDGDPTTIQSSALVGMEDLRVSDLLIPGLCEWDEGLLEELFQSRDVDCIRRLRAPRGDAIDERIWNFSRNGKYLVRSAYRLCMEIIIDDTHLHHQGRWNDLWKLDVPHSLCHFLWRVAQAVLPTRAALVSRHIPIPTECGLCAGQEE
ncbi:Uncharacterized mitochondrial protein AtMg00310 [Linum grandiflorum]